MSIDIDFVSFGRYLSHKYRKKSLDAAAKTGLDALKLLLQISS